ncbi:MAG TPA: hypothetical protein VEW07_05855 [Solirubrobacterales bacterium]|nr:hypothetical protein [Solirubrobacterales bacterium]
MDLDRLSSGEKVASGSAILLFIFMFFHWFGVQLSDPTPLAPSRSVVPGKSAWEALDYIPIILLIAIITALAVAALRLANAGLELSVQLNAVVALLGIVSVLLILLRIIDPPSFGSSGAITVEGTVQLPIFLALLAAAGVAFGGYRAVRDEDHRVRHEI